ncbi:MAG TPA: GAF domain-containing protein [Candidatus Acidoferrum sp.]|jgi:uroporphyrinogen-III synthase|nr:GAF domain-containing protein [Candidatus Acidoferrum sp.]
MNASGERAEGRSKHVLSCGGLPDRLPHPHDFLREIAGRTESAVPFSELLTQVVDFVTSVVECDSCFVYVLEGDDLVLRASKNPHPDVVDRLKVRIGEGITGWVAQHREPVAVPRQAGSDSRFQFFNELPEDEFESFLSVPLLSRGRVVGAINLQNRLPHEYTQREVATISTVGFLIGAEIEMASLEREKLQLSSRLEIRKLLDRAKGILQKDMGISEPEAYEVLQRQSQFHRKPMKAIAEAIILSYSVKHDATGLQDVRVKQRYAAG